MTTTDNDNAAPMTGLILSAEASARLKALCAKHGFANALATTLDFYEGQHPEWLTDFVASLGPSDFDDVMEGELSEEGEIVRKRSLTKPVEV